MKKGKQEEWKRGEERGGERKGRGMLRDQVSEKESIAR